MLERAKKKGANCGGVGGWRMLIQVLISVILAGRIRYAEAFHTSGMCVQVGQANDNNLQHDYKDQRRMGPWTIGTRKFDIIHDFLDFSCGGNSECYVENGETYNKTCPYPRVLPIPKPDIPQLFAEACVDQETVELRTYAVYQDGKVMNGWLHFEFELKDPENEIVALYVQMRDEFYNAIGEFVSDPKEQCIPSNANLTQPSEYQILPCSAVGFREAKNANAIFMANREAFKYPEKAERYLPGYPNIKRIDRGIHFTWRLSEYWCNRHLRFRPEATILHKKALAAGKKGKPPLLYRKAAFYWLKPKWYGTADIKLPQATLDCTKQVIDESGNGKLKKASDGKFVAPWLHEEGVPGLFRYDYYAQINYYWDTYVKIDTIKSCQWNTRRFKPIKEHAADALQPFARDIAPTFAGRCTHHYEKTPSHDALQGCNLDTEAEEFKDILAAYPNLETYKTYVNVLTTNRTGLCGVTCHVPTAANITDIQSFKDTTGEKNFTQTVIFQTASRTESKVEKLIVGRKYHALLCIVWTMFLTPLGIFCARYFKETCMNVTCTGAHFWFWVHITTAVASAALFVSSLSGIWSNLETWGRNQDGGGVTHRYLGYLSVSLFLLMMILGGFRPLEKKMRLIMMTAHSVLGFLIYFSNIFAMFSSFNIPGSPTIGNCDAHGFSTEPSPAIYPIIIWVVLDAGLHIAMTVMQAMKDKTVGLRRPWYCPIIPILPHDSADDFVGSSLRKITLMVYAGAAFILTSTTIGIVMNGPGNKACADLLGTSSCTEKWGCSASAMAYALKENRTKPSGGVY